VIPYVAHHQAATAPTQSNKKPLLPKGKRKLAKPAARRPKPAAR